MTELNNKLIITVEFKDEAKEDYLMLKKKLRMENNNDVLRWAVAFANKRYQ
jgi:hypothetical protein